MSRKSGLLEMRRHGGESRARKRRELKFRNDAWFYERGTCINDDNAIE